MKPQPLCPDAVAKDAPQAEPERIAAGQHHHSLISRPWLQAVHQSPRVIAADQLGLGVPQPVLQSSLQPLRCCNHGGRPQQRLLWSGQRGGCPGVGADHIDHPVILVSGFAGPWPLAQALLNVMHWSSVFMVFAGMIMICLLCLPFMKTQARATKAEIEESLGAILSRAVRDPNYLMIFIGFFSCGFQLAFVTAHFPALVTEICATIRPDSLLARLGVDTTAELGALSIGVIGLFNIVGTIVAGALGDRYRKKSLLAMIYAGRTLIAAWFILMPVTPTTVLVFSVIMGSLWLATVPLTSGLVAYLYGLRYMGTLYGLVFLSHQLGSFFGVWLGGTFYDQFGSYTIVWWVGVGTGVLSTLVHLPIREEGRPAASTA